MTVPALTLAGALAAATHRGAPSWHTIGRRARHLALGLVEAGLPGGSVVRIDGRLGAERTAVELAVMAAGGATTSDVDVDAWRAIDVDTVASLDELAAKGEAADRGRPDRFEELVASVTPDDIATIAAGHRLTHRNLLWAARSLVRWLGATDADRLLVRSAPDDVATRLTGPYLAAALGADLRHDPDPASARPTLLFADAAFWDALAGRLSTAASERTLRVARARAAGDPLTAVERVRARLATRSLRAVHDRLGVGECRAFVCLGPLPAAGTRRELAAAGIDVVGTWGHPGVAGLAAAGDPPCPLPGVTIGIDDDGNVAVRSPSAAVDPGGDGWFHTGGPGSLDERGALIT